MNLLLKLNLYPLLGLEPRAALYKVEEALKRLESDSAPLSHEDKVALSILADPERKIAYDMICEAFSREHRTLPRFSNKEEMHAIEAVASILDFRLTQVGVGVFRIGEMNSKPSAAPNDGTTDDDVEVNSKRSLYIGEFEVPVRIFRFNSLYDAIEKAKYLNVRPLGSDERYERVYSNDEMLKEEFSFNDSGLFVETERGSHAAIYFETASKCFPLEDAARVLFDHPLEAVANRLGFRASPTRAQQAVKLYFSELAKLMHELDNRIQLQHTTKLFLRYAKQLDFLT